MDMAQKSTPDVFDDSYKKLSKEEIKKIYEKYTRYFSEYISGTYKDITPKKGEKDRKGCN